MQRELLRYISRDLTVSREYKDRRPSSLRARSLSLSVISERPFLIKLFLSNFCHDFRSNATRFILSTAILRTVYPSRAIFRDILLFINLMHFRGAREILYFCNKCVECCRLLKATGSTCFNFRIHYDVRSKRIFSMGYLLLKKRNLEYFQK